MLPLYLCLNQALCVCVGARVCVCVRERAKTHTFSTLSAIPQLEAKNPICLLLIRGQYVCLLVCVCDTHYIPFMCESA